MTSVFLWPGYYNKGNFEASDYAGLNQFPAEGCLVEVSAAGTEVDMSGAVLDGEGDGGVGIYVHDCDDVIIRNGVIKGFHHGIRAVNASRLTILNCVVSDNHNPIDTGWLPDSIEPVEEGFGGGIYLYGVSDSIIEGNHLNNNFNGISLVRCERNKIAGNNASYSANIGIHLLGSSHNEIDGNRADHCIRYTDRFWCDTADSAGILLEEYSHYNKIIGNSLRYSGDGFFIRANNRHSSNHNYVARNDGSFSPNNAFEAVFSRFNVFEDNVADFSNYGFWLGYSRDTVVLRNRTRSNRLDGIAIEAGRGNRIKQNTIIGNRTGIRLWRLASPTENEKEDSATGSYVISNNEIKDSREWAIVYPDDLEVRLAENRLENNRQDVLREPAEYANPTVEASE